MKLIVEMKMRCQAVYTNLDDKIPLAKHLYNGGEMIALFDKDVKSREMIEVIIYSRAIRTTSGKYLHHLPLDMSL